MTTVLEQQAEHITTLSAKIEQLENEIDYTATMIASDSADNNVGAGFESNVARYKVIRDSLKAAGQAYWDVLDA
ncbi:hypothetical protein [Brevibacterium marinum]|uniref:Outer membrane murein-binding lipoprotein Lpp n=1 Tax=Brevibacterium marinum TaxID=418643 RepID=A0A846S1D5_9MICO|nr:hypothetical protein [Brevibacterium marinum]NJC57290.1 outer membrane murein-binding lipoprotein Lpp [Brevibacterium marinum]